MIECFKFFLYPIISFIGLWGLTSCSPSVQGLIAYYPFDGNARDASGNKYHGIVYGAQLTADQSGNENQAYYFDGNAAIELPFSINPSTYPELTITAWARLDTLKGFTGYLVSHDDGGYDRSMLFNDPRGGWFAFTGSPKTIGPIPASKAWAFLAVTYNQETNEVTFYVNEGRKHGKGKSGEGYANTLIGKSPGHGYPFRGAIDEVRFYSRILSQDELTALMETR